MPHKPGFGAIFGIVSEEGLVKDNSPVVLVDPRRDADGIQRIIGRQFTRSDGGFEFAGLDTSYTDYMLLATDEDGTDPKNALVQDRTQPIDARSGLVDPAAWYYIARSEGAVAMLTGFPTTEQAPLKAFCPNHGSMWREPQPEAGEVVSGIEGAPQMSGIHLGVDQCLMSVSTPFQDTVPGTVEASLEFVFDKNSAAADVVCYLAIVGATNNTSHQFFELSNTHNNSSYFPVIGIRYGISADVLDGEMSIADIDDSGSNTAPFGGPNKEVLFSGVDMSPYSGTVHIVVTLVAGNNYNVYINGSLVTSGSVLNQYSIYRMDQNNGTFVAVGGSSRGNDVGLPDYASLLFGTNVTFILATGYYRTLTLAQVQARYNALFDSSSSPVLTGTHKNLYQSFPLLLVPFDDSDVTNYVSNDMLNGLTYQPSNVAHLRGSQSMTSFAAGVGSPISGRNAVSFDGADFLETKYSAPASAIFEDELSFCVWLYVDALNGTVQHVIEKSLPIESTDSENFWFALRINASNAIEVLVKEATSLNTYTFTYTPSAASWFFVGIDIDKTSSTNKELRLYVGDETTTPTLEESLTLASGPLPVRGLQPGTDRFGKDLISNEREILTRIGKNFAGRMSFLSLLPKVQGLTRWQEIWAAKDIV